MPKAIIRRRIKRSPAVLRYMTMFGSGTCGQGYYNYGCCNCCCCPLPDRVQTDCCTIGLTQTDCCADVASVLLITFSSSLCTDLDGLEVFLEYDALADWWVGSIDQGDTCWITVGCRDDVWKITMQASVDPQEPSFAADSSQCDPFELQFTDIPPGGCCLLADTDIDATVTPAASGIKTTLYGCITGTSCDITTTLSYSFNFGWWEASTDNTCSTTASTVYTTLWCNNGNFEINVNCNGLGTPTVAATTTMCWPLTLTWESLATGCGDSIDVVNAVIMDKPFDCGGGIQTDCCDNSLPSILTATFTSPGCACTNAAIVSLTWNVPEQRYKGVMSVTCGSLYVVMECDQSAPNVSQYRLNASCVDYPAGATGVFGTTNDCDPINISFTGVDVGSCTGCIAQTASVIVTV